MPVRRRRFRIVLDWTNPEGSMEHRRAAARVACCFTMLVMPLAAGAAQARVAKPCELVTTSEVATAAGWKPSAPKADTYGSTATCQFTGNALKHETVVVVVSTPVPKFANSTAMAAWRTERGKRHPELATAVSPLEGLGAPAIRSGDGSAPPTVEAAVNGRLLGITAPTFEAAQALAKTAIARLR
jgi:hypothetical protein